MIHPYLFEFFATVLFVYVVIATGNCFAIGATITLICMVGADISGASVNPAVSLAMLTSGKLGIEHIFPYICVEILGALTAVELFKVLNKVSRKKVEKDT